MKADRLNFHKLWEVNFAQFLDPTPVINGHPLYTINY